MEMGLLGGWMQRREEDGRVDRCLLFIVRVHDKGLGKYMVKIPDMIDFLHHVDQEWSKPE